MEKEFSAVVFKSRGGEQVRKRSYIEVRNKSLTVLSNRFVNRYCAASHGLAARRRSQTLSQLNRKQFSLALRTSTSPLRPLPPAPETGTKLYHWISPMIVAFPLSTFDVGSRAATSRLEYSDNIVSELSTHVSFFSFFFFRENTFARCKMVISVAFVLFSVLSYKFVVCWNIMEIE